ncbi:MAG TPA: YbjN domain-containing protein [Stellaceae bacterium]|nr:YbjN domain-containing protein [Stellaceae bacterium]
MTSLLVAESGSTTNPLDLIEEMMEANDWSHDRTSDDELLVEIQGRWCAYHLLFVWQHEMSALHFSCGFEMKTAPERRDAVNALLAMVNERLWLGHFDLAFDDHSPAFRQGVLLRGTGSASTEQIEDLIDIALTECERFYPAFELVIRGGKRAEDAIAATMIDPIGEA